MGEVYRARDTRLNRDVAVKVLLDSVAADTDRRARFEREARAIAALSHPNILAIFDTGEHDGRLFVVTELLEGESLRTELFGRALPVRKAIEIGVQIAGGLGAAHAKGIVHRDLKPENIFLLTDGRAKILDFGLAQKASTNSGATETASAITDPGVVMGTAGYMSPEQVRGQTVDARTDLFALGVVLYEMLSGQRAFRRETMADTMSAILTTDPPALAGSRAEISPALDRIVRHCLEKNPAERFQTARDVAFALEALTDASSGQMVTVAKLPPRRGFGRNVAVLLTAVAVAVAAWFAGRESRPTRSPSPKRLSIVLSGGLTPIEGPGQVAISPDGRTIALAASRPGETRTLLWLRGINDTEFKPVPHTEEGIYPFWAPDGHAVGFFTSNKLKVVSTAGGEPEAIADAPDARGASWGRRDVIVFAPDSSGALFSVPARGGKTTPVTRLNTAKNETAHRFPVFLPDGRRFLFGVLPTPAGRMQVELGSIDGADVQPVMEAESGVAISDAGYLLFAERHRIVAAPFDARSGTVSAGATVPIGAVAEYFNFIGNSIGASPVSASADGTLVQVAEPFVSTKLEWVDAQGKTLAMLDSPPGRSTIEAISHDNRHAILHRISLDGESDLWMADLESGRVTRWAGEGFYTTSTFSPDDREVAFSYAKLSAVDIFVKPADSPQAEPQPVVQNPSLFKEPCGWARTSEGEYIIYTQLSGASATGLWMIPRTAGGSPSLIVKPDLGALTCRPSKDGRWLAYVGIDASGSPDLIVQSFPRGNHSQRVDRNVSSVTWAEDGRSLIWVVGLPDGSSVTRQANVQPGAEFRLGPVRVIPNPANVPNVVSGVTRDWSRRLISIATETPSTPHLTVITDWTALLNGR